MTTKTWKVGDRAFGVGYDLDSSDHFGGPCDVLQVFGDSTKVMARVHGMDSRVEMTPIFEQRVDAEIAAQEENVARAEIEMRNLSGRYAHQKGKRDAAREQLAALRTRKGAA